MNIFELKSEESEQAIIASLLLKSRMIYDISDLKPEHFAIHANKIIFTAIKKLVENGEAVYQLTIANHITMSELNKIGGVALFDNYKDGSATTEGLRGYVSAVQDMALRRSLILAAQKTINAAQRTSKPAKDTLNESQIELGEITKASVKSKWFKISECVKKVHEDILSPKKETQFLATGIGKLDRFTAGTGRGQLIIVAGRPGMGKSALAFNIGTNAALANVKTCLASLEDTKEFVTRRITARLGNIDYDSLIHDNLDRQERASFFEAANMLEDAPLWIDDKAGKSATDICNLAAAKHAQGECDLLIVDHLTELAITGDEYASTTQAARELRDCAKNLNIPVILLCQLNRAVENRNPPVPRLSDLRDSGKIEEMARSVWLCYRPYYYDHGADPNMLELIIAKANHGKTGIVELYCDLSRMYIGENPHAYHEPDSRDY